MKRGKVFVALLLVAALCLTLFSACNKAQAPVNTATDTSSTPVDAAPAEATPTDSTPTDNEESEPTPPPTEEPEEIEEIELWYFDLRMTAADYGEHVQDAINEITEKEIGVHVNMNWITAADFANNFNLAMSGGECVDIVQIFTPTRISALYANKQVMDITELAKEYAPDALGIMSDYLGPFTFDGKLYGIPTFKNWSSNGYIIMRKDILDELGLTEKAKNLTKWSEYEEILAEVHDKYEGTGLYGVGNSTVGAVLSTNGVAFGSDNFSDVTIWDALADPVNVVMTDDNGHVSLYPASEMFENECQRVLHWYEEGWLYPDAHIATEHGDEEMKQNVIFSSIQGSEIGVETTKGASVGYELVCPMLYTGMISTKAVSGWGAAVPYTSENPEAALKMLNLMYTNPELMNIMVWGVEGVDYNVVDGQVKHVDGGHFYEADFLMGNNTILTPLFGNGADFYDRVIDTINNAKTSPYLGLSIDTSSLDMYIGQITAVNDQYVKSLTCGAYTKESYEEYLTKLDAAGVQDYLGAFQEQLDAWLAANN